MKTVKLFFVTILFSFSISLCAQIHHVSSVNFTYIDLLNYSSFCRKDITDRVAKNIAEGKLIVYQDTNFKKPVRVEEYHKLIESKKDVQVPNPQNPDDIYDLIDTVIFFEQGPEAVVLNGETIEIICGSGAKMYVETKKLSQLLDSRLLAMLNFFKLKGLKTINDYSFAVFFKTLVSQLGADLYDCGIKGEVKPYRNDSLASFFTTNEIKERVICSETIQIQNPNNPGDIYDLIDTVIVREFNPDSINMIRLFFEWETDGFETEAEFFAIAPSFRPVFRGFELPPTPIFTIKASDYLKRLKGQEKAFWPHFYSYMLQNRSAGGEYDVFDENNLLTE